MASSFPDSFDQLTGDSTRSLDDDGYFGYDPRLASQQFDSFSNFSDSESVKHSALDDSSKFPSAYHVSDGGFPADPAEFSSFAPEDDEGGFGGPILPPPAEMEPEDGVALKEWRRANLIRLAEKEKREKESLSQIIGEAEEYKVEFYKKRNVSCEANKGTNREKEKLFLVSHEKFHSEADKTYWKAITELIPKEVAAIEKRGKKDEDKNKPSVAVMRGPKPGKPTDLSRMRHILLKLKHNAPPHLEHVPPPPQPPAVDPKTAAAASSAPPPPPNAAAVAVA